MIRALQHSLRTHVLASSMERADRLPGVEFRALQHSLRTRVPAGSMERADRLPGVEFRADALAPEVFR